MAGIFTRGQVEIPPFEPGSVALAELAKAHEAAAVDCIEGAKGTYRDPIWGWQDKMRLEVVRYYAAVGAEPAAREALTRISRLSPPYTFQGLFAIMNAFEKPQDSRRAWVLAQTSRDPRDYNSRQRLQMVRHDVAHGRTEGLEPYIEGIPLVTERTLAGLALANTVDEALALRSQYPFEPLAMGGDVEDRMAIECNPGKARIDLAVAATGLIDMHKAVVASLGDLVRPDSISKEVHAYIASLLQQGRRADIDSILAAVTRKGYVDHYNAESALVFIAQTTQTEVDIAKALATIRSLDNEYVRAGLLERLVGVYAELGDLEAAESLILETKGGFSGSTVGYDRALACLQLLRGYLRTGDVDTAERAYNAAMSSDRKSIFVTGRLILAQYLRTGGADFRNEE